MTFSALNLPTISKNNMWSSPYIGAFYFSYGRVYVVCYSVISVASHVLPYTVTEIVTDITLSLMFLVLAAVLIPGF